MRTFFSAIALTGIFLLCANVQTKAFPLPVKKYTEKMCWCGIAVIRCDYGNGTCSPAYQYFCDEVCPPY
jgi:hypothetical protein